MHTDRGHCALVYAFGAVTINLTKTGLTHTPEVSNQVFELATQSAELRGQFISNGVVTIRSIVVSILLSVCLMALYSFDLAFIYLREAITMILVLRVDNAATMSRLNPHERARRQRLYWEAFVHERFQAIVKYRPVMLPPLSSGIPEFDSSPPLGVHEGFVQIIELFLVVDDTFLRNWLSFASSPASTAITATWIKEKQRELDDQDLASPTLTSLSSGYSSASLSDMQQADLIITRH